MRYHNACFLLPILVCSLIFPFALCGQMFSEANNAGDAVSDNLPSVGGSWDDLNNDGYPELLVTGFDVGQNNRLYLNQQDGTYLSQLNTPFTQTPGNWGSVIGLLGDCDNDGDNDVMLCSYRDNNGQKLPLQLLQNEGMPDFSLTRDTLFTSPNGSYPTASWVDYDLDGDLDFFAGAASGATDLFYRNEGSGTFIRLDSLSFLTFRSGFITHDSWVDIDEDGDLDLYISNYSAPNANTLHLSMLVETGDPNYFVQTDIPGLTGEPGANIGVNWIDFDNDGDLDLYQNHYNARDRFFRNDGNLVFVEMMDHPMLDVVAYTNFNIWADYDNDGDLDLALAHQQGGSSKGKIYRNQEGEFTLLSSEEAGAISSTFVAQAQSGGVADYDADGDVDIYVVNTVSQAVAAPNFLFRNETDNQNNWLKVKLKGTNSSPNGFGSKIFVSAIINGDTVRQMRFVSGGTTSYSFQESTIQHFGLKDAEVVLTLEVHWLSGPIDVCTDITANQLIEIEEGSCLTNHTESLPGENSDFQLNNLLPNPGGQTLTCHIQSERSSQINWRLINESGQVSMQDTSWLQKGTNQININTALLPTGWYVLEIWTNQSKTARRWLKSE